MVLDKLFGKKDKFFLEIDPATPAAETTPAITAAPVAEVATPAPVAAPTPAEPSEAAAPVVVEAPAPTPAKEIPPITFAADLSVPAVNTGRRRPGPSLEPFVRIANEVVNR